MAVLQRNVPVVTTEPTLLVERLGVGTHRIQLVVIDQAGNESAPALATIRVVTFQPPIVVEPPIILQPPIVVQPPVIVRPPVIVQPPVVVQPRPPSGSPRPERAPRKAAAKKAVPKKQPRKPPRKEKP